MRALTEEYARRAVQLRYYYTFCPVDDERTLLGHIRDRTKVYVLYYRSEILMVRIRTVEFQLGFQGDAIRKAAVQTLLDGVAGRIYIVVQELQDEIIARVGNREIFRKNLIKPLVISFFRRRLQLEKVAERF